MKDLQERIVELENAILLSPLYQPLDLFKVQHSASGMSDDSYLHYLEGIVENLEDLK